jgi:hypothetical protein
MSSANFAALLETFFTDRLIGQRRVSPHTIAATVRLRRKRGVWMVPSQADSGKSYMVDLKGDAPTCSCPDHETRRMKCKHIHAVALDRQSFQTAHSPAHRNRSAGVSLGRFTER